MSKKVYKKPERTPSHAGRILKSGFIDQYDLRIETVAELLGIARGHLSRIINAHSPVTPDIAIKLEVLTKTPASHWLAIQSKYDIYMMEQEKEFIKYKEILDSWVNNSLPMQPEERRSDKKSQRLVIKASNIAKQLGKKKKAA